MSSGRAGDPGTARTAGALTGLSMSLAPPRRMDTGANGHALPLTTVCRGHSSLPEQVRAGRPPPPRRWCCAGARGSGGTSPLLLGPRPFTAFSYSALAFLVLVRRRPRQARSRPLLWSPRALAKSRAPASNWYSAFLPPPRFPYFTQHFD